MRDGFIDEATAQKFRKKKKKNIIKESIGFAGCKMARRVFGVAGVAEIRGIEDKALRRKAEVMALKISREFVMGYESIESVDDVLEMVRL